MTREDYINTLELDNAELRKENEELKSQLRGTTHCFDEEEHNKLKEEITNLSKEIDMWNAKYNDMFDENRMLKEALETKSYCKYANKCDELDDCSREEYEVEEPTAEELANKILQKYKEIVKGGNDNE